MKKLLRKFRILVKQLLRKEVALKKDLALPTERHGSIYGGWAIRRDSLSHESVVYSFGLGEDASFDLELIDKYDITLHAFDPTPRSIVWAREHIKESRFVLHQFGLAAIDGELQFNPPENPEHVSHTFLERENEAGAIMLPVKRLQTIMQELGHNRIDILKMDIEGAEYSVIDDLLKTSIRPQQLLVEFHHRFPEVGVSMTYGAINKLREAGYKLFSISESNEEYSFVLLS